MIKVKKQKKKVTQCPNCQYNIQIHPDIVKEKLYPGSESSEVIATYIECPVCGERILKQLDTSESRALAMKGVKLELIQRDSKKKLSPKQKQRLKDIEMMLSRIRSQLNSAFWDEIYQSLNQDEEDQTEIDDQELIPGNEVTGTDNAGERNEHVG